MAVCGGCGLEIEGGTEACQKLFDDFRAREMSELAPSYASTRLSVDVYCLQHPDRYCVTAKSLAAHLTGAGWALERCGAESGLRVLQRWLNGNVALNKPPLPTQRGEVTIAVMNDVRDTESYLAALDRWARSTWSAYSGLHEVARGWMDEAVKS